MTLLVIALLSCVVAGLNAEPAGPWARWEPVWQGQLRTASLRPPDSDPTEAPSERFSASVFAKMVGKGLRPPGDDDDRTSLSPELQSASMDDEFDEFAAAEAPPERFSASVFAKMVGKDLWDNFAPRRVRSLADSHVLGYSLRTARDSVLNELSPMQRAFLEAAPVIASASLASTPQWLSETLSIQERSASAAKSLSLAAAAARRRARSAQSAIQTFMKEGAGANVAAMGGIWTGKLSLFEIAEELRLRVLYIDTLETLRREIPSTVRDYVARMYPTS